MSSRLVLIFDKVIDFSSFPYIEYWYPFGSFSSMTNI
ncbi:hypothetical protein Zm00014a_042462 [Zea mays]|uniref:Uncharacterized protein n=1 Tax=Zea mays TaxID=4577 RepID=A0A3L6FYE9_MAIZE|nr:hypothetical protein Zm00014a_042462 [Zea mays]